MAHELHDEHAKEAVDGTYGAKSEKRLLRSHLPKLAGTITIHTIDEIGRKTPLLVDLKPSGNNYMTDSHNSGGIVGLLLELKHLLCLDAMTVTGQTLGQELANAALPIIPRERVIQPFSEPLCPASSLVVLRGNLALAVRVMKASASKYKHLLQHTGRAVVFANSSDMAERKDDPNLEVTKNSVLVLQNIGPVGNPGMRVKVGTAGGTIVIHIVPEAADPSSILGIVQTGNTITFDVEKRLLRLNVSDEEISRRQEERAKTLQEKEAPWVTRDDMRGYRGLYMREVKQAQFGADFKFLTAEGPCAK
uniref:Uncharacterized protein n=1 Tax=Bionectria ochroleuca TaxID=29856 RepID=A0A8H7N3S1_BIOOC